MLFALSTYAKAGFDGVTRTRAVQRLAASLDAAALDAYADQLIAAFSSGSLLLDGALLCPCTAARFCSHPVVVWLCCCNVERIAFSSGSLLLDGALRCSRA